MKDYIGSIIIGAVALLFVTLFCSMHIVDAGFRGVPVTFGTVSEASLENGISFMNPFTVVHDVDVRTQVVEAETNTYTADIQTATLTYILTFNVVPVNVCTLYEEVGTDDYVPKKITPVVNDVLKDVVGKWQAQELVANREKAREQVLSALKQNLDERFFENITFQITNLDYSDNFEKAIENKVIAEQKAQEAVNNTRRIEEEAQQKIISAKAEAEAMEIKSEALAKNKGLTEYEAVQRWDGKLPTYMLGNSVPFINIGGK